MAMTHAKRSKRPLPDPRGHPAHRPVADQHRRDRRCDAGRAGHPRSHGLHEDRRHAGDHRPVHDHPADPRVRHPRVIPPPRRRRGLGDRRDPGHRPRGHGGRGRIDAVRRAGIARRADVRRPPRPRAPAQARVHRQLPLAVSVLIGFLTGVGIQVAMGQFGAMFGVPGQSRHDHREVRGERPADPDRWQPADARSSRPSS